MADLHNAFKALSPTKFADLPTEDESALKSWLSDLFVESQVILDSIPIVDPAETSATPRTSSSSIASNASEITASSARPPPPSPEHQALQKEWGKPIKLKASDNTLGMSVYKVSGKDGRGAWFARRSVHEGLPFARFKKALQMEFPESLAVQGAPGEGNVRGIGGETKVEAIEVPGKGRVEVYRLSAQFPGPTTPRDFVTLLITSDGAVTGGEGEEHAPRHYMVVSKPCDHEKTQPQNGFIRGFYESVEFIREIPRARKASQSTSDLPQQVAQTGDIGRDAIIRNARQQNKTFPAETVSENDLSRPRSSTVPGTSTSEGHEEINPVEWIMVTRSDPGGSVPRFMVERGTPSSICADAEKFLNWACKQDFDDEDVAKAMEPIRPDRPPHRQSFQSFRSSRMAGIQDESVAPEKEAVGQQSSEHTRQESSTSQQQVGIMGAISGATQYLSAYTPQVVLDRLPGSNGGHPEQSKEHLVPPEPDDDADSVASFESADSHLVSNESEHASITSSKDIAPSIKSDEHLTQHEKELRKLEQRRAALESKFSESRVKLEQEATANNAKEEAARHKAIEKHEKELQKQKEKYEKELQKIEQKQEKERKKMEEKKRKQLDKDEKFKLTRERDEARQELDIVKKEAAALRAVVEDLQHQNTALVAKLEKASLADDLSGDGSRAPSRLSGHKKEKGRAHSDSASTSTKSQ